MTDNTTTVDMNNQPTTTTNTNNNISTTTHNNNSISLKRNQSISSSTSSKVGTHDGAPPQQHSHQPLTNSTTFPASPALSTLTKNTSSSDSCSSAHVHSSAFGAGGSNSRMNVDDILNKSKFKGKRRGRRKSSLGVKTVNGGGVGGVRVSKPAAKKLIGVPSNNYHQKVKANNTKVHNKQDGQNERKMRLQRLQQEQLLKQKRKLTSMGSSSGGGSSVLKRQSSLDSRTSLDREMENTQEIERSEEKSVSSRSSSRSSSSNRKKRAAETTSGSSISESIPQQRRSKRAKSSIPTSYNVTELTKQNSIMSEIEVKKSSSSVVAVAAGSSQVESAEAQSNEELAEGKDKNIPKEDETQEEEEEPDSVQSALSTLLTKYNSCIGLPSSTIPLSSTKTLPSTAKAATTWEIVQLLVSTLRYINLLDPKSVNTEEYKEVVNGLSNVLKSVSCVKLLVMNRTSVVQGEAKAKGGNGEQVNGDNQEEDDEDSITKITNYNTKLLSNIQLQIWMRMMIWSLEEVAGWEFLCQIVSLADTKLIQQQGVDGGDKGGKGKKKKKKKGKKQQKKTTKEKDMSPRDNLVQDIRQLMELAPYVLPPSMEFAQWLKDTLTLGFRQSIPEYGVELFDHFEIELAAAEPIVLKRSDTDTSRRSERSHVSHSPVKDNTTTKGGVTGSNSSASPTKNITEKRHKRQQAYFASLAEEENKASAASGSSSIKTDDETATITGSVSTVTSTSRASSKSVREKDDNILLKTSVSLTSTIPSRTSNPFLKGSARGSYVGSHLSSKLSNITSLFREVKAAPKTKPKAKAPQAASKKAPPTQQAAIAGIKRKNSLPKQLSVTSVKPATTTTTRFKATITEESTVSSVPNEPQSKRRRPAVSSLRASSYTARATANPRAASSSFTVGETPMKRPIIEETPAKNPQPGAVRQRLRLRDDRPYMGNAIVAETPQQPLMRGGSSSGGQEDSSFLPTNLWSRQYQHSSGTRRPPQRAGWIDTRHRQQQQNGNNNSHLSPVVNLGASGSMNLGFSPMPHQEDMASALAKAAKSAASRKRK